MKPPSYTTSAYIEAFAHLKHCLDIQLDQGVVRLLKQRKVEGVNRVGQIII